MGKYLVFLESKELKNKRLFRLMIKQRKTRNLGINRSKDKEKIYKYIEDVLKIKEKFCARGTSKKESEYSFVHEGKNPLPIRDFNLQYSYIDDKGNVRINSKDGLQIYCIPCERKYRRGRLNKWSDKYSKMTDKGVYDNYRKNYGKLCHCSMCGKMKKPEDFPISRRMDRGLHNTCKECAKAYTEAVGNRWAIYSPDGHHIIIVDSEDKCQECSSKLKLHKDHIWPLSKGGTDNKENIQILCEPHNFSKSASIIGFNSIGEVKEEMICERYRDLLEKAKEKKWNLNKFELEISKQVREFILRKKNLSDEQLRDFFEEEKAKNNRKHNTDRAIRKFREYCDKSILEINEYISKNS